MGGANCKRGLKTHLKFQIYIQSNGHKISTQSDCGGTLTGESGTFNSPGYPDHYYDYLDCVWDITVETGKVVRLGFDHLEIENCASDCVCDWVEFVYVRVQRYTYRVSEKSACTF